MTSRTTSRLTTDFGPRLRASAGSSVCSQTATRWPERDQLVQIVVRSLDRHATHGDVFAKVFAALGQHDAERSARRSSRRRRTVRRNRPCGRTAGNRGLARLISRYCAIMGVTRLSAPDRLRSSRSRRREATSPIGSAVSLVLGIGFPSGRATQQSRLLTQPAKSTQESFSNGFSAARKSVKLSVIVQRNACHFASHG